MRQPEVLSRRQICSDDRKHVPTGLLVLPGANFARLLINFRSIRPSSFFAFSVVFWSCEKCEINYESAWFVSCVGCVSLYPVPSENGVWRRLHVRLCASGNGQMAAGRAGAMAKVTERIVLDRMYCLLVDRPNE